MPARVIRVLIVDDSALIREFLRSTLSAEPDIEVVGAASDPFIARDKFLKFRPDVLTLDIEMPRMDGLTFLEKLMNAHPTPVVMFSSITQQGAEATMKALALGAVDFVAKPVQNMRQQLPELASELVEKVRAAAGVKARPKKFNAASLTVPRKVEVDEVVRLAKTPPPKGGPTIVLIGASTGGTVALEEVLCRLPADSPPIAVVQHMPEHFTLAFAQRLDEHAHISITEATDGQPVRPGTCVIAPGGKHMLLERNASGYYVKIKDGPPVNRHKPSVDVLFRSGVNSAGPNAVAIIMTGMGDDGAKAMKELHNSGSFTIAQNEQTCVVYGMPKAAVELGAVDRVVPLENIPHMIMGVWSNGSAG